MSTTTGPDRGVSTTTTGGDVGAVVTLDATAGDRGAVVTLDATAGDPGVGALTPAAAVAAIRHGRPRDPHVDEAIRQAALELLIEEGFARMSIEGVANRAGVGKAAIYRRWDSKTALVVEAVHDRVACKTVDWPRTGDIRADLEAIFTQLNASMSTVEGQLMTNLVSELARNPELSTAFTQQFVAARRAEMRDRVQAAMDDGQLPPGDVELLAEVGFAIIRNRKLLSNEPIDEHLPQRIVRQFFPKETS